MGLGERLQTAQHRSFSLGYALLAHARSQLNAAAMASGGMRATHGMTKNGSATASTGRCQRRMCKNLNRSLACNGIAPACAARRVQGRQRPLLLPPHGHRPSLALPAHVRTPRHNARGRRRYRLRAPLCRWRWRSCNGGEIFGEPPSVATRAERKYNLREQLEHGSSHQA